MLLRQPALNCPLPDAQALGNGTGTQTCLHQHKRLLIALFASRLAVPVARGVLNRLERRLCWAEALAQVFPARRYHAIQILRQILRHVPPTRHVCSLREGCSDGRGKLLGSIPRHDLNRRMVLEPGPHGLLGAISKQGNRLPLLQVDDDGSIPLSALPDPLINANDPGRRDGRKWEGVHEAQDRSGSRLDAEVFGAAGA